MWGFASAPRSLANRMADITARLLWYRLTEAYKSTSEAWAISWSGVDSESALSWLRRVDVLDMLFMGWLLAALIVIGAVNVYLRWFRSSRRGGSSVAQSGSFSGTVSSGFRWNSTGEVGETVKWINAAMSWFGEQQRNATLVDTVLKALTEEAKRHTVCCHRLMILYMFCVVFLTVS